MHGLFIWETTRLEKMEFQAEKGRTSMGEMKRKGR